MATKAERYEGIDGLKAYAIIGIALMHVLANGEYGIGGFVFERLIPSFTNLVFLFMMVSGFGMCCGYYQKIVDQKISVEDFYKKRYIKIWPYFALLCALDFVISPSKKSLFEVFANLTLCQGLLPNAKISVIGVSWTLAVIFVFYMLFPFFCFLIGNKKRAWGVAVAALVFNWLCGIYFFDGNHIADRAAVNFSARTNILYCAVYFIAGGLIFLYRKELAEFNHVVFIIRKDIAKEFKEVIGDRIASICASHDVTVDYAFQDINDIPGALPEGRTKPWGTGQAVLAAKSVIDTPFIVINADDYYGKEGFKAVHEYLVNGGKSCMAGFVLKNTLSDNGGVTRGICKMDDQNNLTEVVETKNIVKTATGAEADGVAVDVNSLVSMNMWGLTPDFLDVLEEGFKEFFEKEVPGNPLKAEYLIPIFIGELLEKGKMSVKVLKTNDTWYGMTYHEDVAAVKDSFKKMLENGVYKADLFSNL